MLILKALFAWGAAALALACLLRIAYGVVCGLLDVTPHLPRESRRRNAAALADPWRPLR